MSTESTPQTSEETPDGVESTDTATPEPVDGQLGDAGKKALQALRAEVKELKAQLKAQDADAGTGDPTGDSPTSDDARDAVTVEPNSQKPRFQGTGDGGAARKAVAANPQLTKDDLNRMSPAAIEKARRNGQLRNLLSGN
jgi:hypothetical protein